MSKDIEHNPPKELLEPYSYLAEQPGKGLRAKVLRAFNLWLRVEEEILLKVIEIIEMLHNASLMIDDIEDGSHLRRGQPVSHQVFGMASTINCANYVYFLALHRLTLLGNSEAVSAFIEEVLCLHRGQGLDIWWRDNCVCPTEEQYREMVRDKTGGLFRLALRVLQCFSEDRTTDYLALINDFSEYFQIMDDHLNLDSKISGKSFAEDLSEGKYSFPVIHCIRNNPDDHRLQNILKQRTHDDELKKYAISFMKTSGSFAYTLQCIDEMRGRVMAHLVRVGGNPYLEKIIAIMDARL